MAMSDHSDMNADIVLKMFMACANGIHPQSVVAHTSRTQKHICIGCTCFGTASSLDRYERHMQIRGQACTPTTPATCSLRSAAIAIAVAAGVDLFLAVAHMFVGQYLALSEQPLHKRCVHWTQLHCLLRRCNFIVDLPQQQYLRTMDAVHAADKTTFHA
jgi:hypothetical protein